MGIKIGSVQIKEVYFGSTKIKQINIGSDIVYINAIPVTYNVDTGVSYIENVEPGQTVLSPQTFTPTKSGYTFVGWREDTVASGTVISSKVMEDAPITLYAVFSKAITVTKYTNGAGATATENKNQYYNNGNIANPSFTLTEPDLSGWTKYGWADAADFTADVANGGSVTLSANKTYYALYYVNVTVTYYNNSSTASTSTKARYVRAGSSWTFSNPTFSLTVATVSGWTARGWSTSSAANGAISYNSATNFTRDSNVTLYASWSKTVTVSYNGNSSTGGSTSASTGTAYRDYKGDVTNASITLRANGFTRTNCTFLGWSTSLSGYSFITSINTDSDTIVYARWRDTTGVTLTTQNIKTSGNRATHTLPSGYYNRLIYVSCVFAPASGVTSMKIMGVGFSGSTTDLPVLVSGYPSTYTYIKYFTPTSATAYSISTFTAKPVGKGLNVTPTIYRVY